MVLLLAGIFLLWAAVLLFRTAARLSKRSRRTSQPPVGRVRRVICEPGRVIAEIEYWGTL